MATPIVIKNIPANLLELSDDSGEIIYEYMLVNKGSEDLTRCVRLTLPRKKLKFVATTPKKFSNPTKNVE